MEKQKIIKRLWPFTAMLTIWVGATVFIVDTIDMKVRNAKQHIHVAAHGAATHETAQWPEDYYRDVGYPLPAPQPVIPAPKRVEDLGLISTEVVRVSGYIIAEGDILLPSTPWRAAPRPWNNGRLQPASLDGIVGHHAMPRYHPPAPGDIALNLIIAQHQAPHGQVVPEVIRLSLMGVMTTPDLVDQKWLEDRIRATFEDFGNQVTCDVVMTSYEDALGRCWLPPSQNMASEDDVDTLVDTLADTPVERDLAYQLLRHGFVTRAPIQDKTEATQRAKFDDDQPQQTVDELYWETERFARQQRLGLWHQYQPVIASRQQP